MEDWWLLGTTLDPQMGPMPRETGAARQGFKRRLLPGPGAVKLFALLARLAVENLRLLWPVDALRFVSSKPHSQLPWNTLRAAGTSISGRIGRSRFVPVMRELNLTCSQQSINSPIFAR